jgi:hypothetical protein
MSTSSINFDAAYSRGDLREATDTLKSWLEQHESLPYFTFDQLCADLASKVNVDSINRVLLRLVAAGQLQVTYRVKLGEGEYSETEYESPEAVPPCVFDSAFEAVGSAGRDKVPSYAPLSR